MLEVNLDYRLHHIRTFVRLHSSSNRTHICGVQSYFLTRGTEWQQLGHSCAERDISYLGYTAVTSEGEVKRVP